MRHLPLLRRFNPAPTQCEGAVDAEKTALTANVKGVTVPQIGGIRVIQAIGFVLSIFVHIYNTVYPSTADHDQNHHLIPGAHARPRVKLPRAAATCARHAAQPRASFDAAAAAAAARSRADKELHSELEQLEVLAMRIMVRPNALSCRAGARRPASPPQTPAQENPGTKQLLDMALGKKLEGKADVKA